MFSVPSLVTYLQSYFVLVKRYQLPATILNSILNGRVFKCYIIFLQQMKHNHANNGLDCTGGFDQIFTYILRALPARRTAGDSYSWHNAGFPGLGKHLDLRIISTTAGLVRVLYGSICVIIFYWHSPLSNYILCRMNMLTYFIADMSFLTFSGDHA